MNGVRPVDEQAVRALYDQHASALLAFVRRLSAGDALLAEDIVQETLLRAWQKSGRVPAEYRRRPKVRHATCGPVGRGAGVGSMSAVPFSTPTINRADQTLRPASSAAGRSQVVVSRTGVLASDEVCTAARESRT